MEKCNIHGIEIDLPIDFIENPQIFSNVLSLDTWNHVLTPDDRKRLKKFLPVLPTDYPHAQEDNLRSLFGGENFKFGNPLQKFQTKLQAGLYTDDIVDYRRRCKAAKIREYKLRLKKFYRKLVNDVLLSRQEVIDQVISSARQDTPISLSWNERRMHQTSFLSGNLDAKYKKIIKEVKDECEDHDMSTDDEVLDPKPQQQFIFNGSTALEAGHFSGSRDSVFMNTAAPSTPGARPMVTDEDYHRMLQSHKRKRMNNKGCPELDTEGITLEDVISRTNVAARRSSKTVVKRKYKVKEKREQKKKFKRKRNNGPNVVPKPLSPTAPQPAANVVQQTNEVQPIIEHNISSDVTSYKVLESSPQCFFSLLRDIFLYLPDATAELDQLERMVREWQQSPSFAASTWASKEHSWIDMIPSALKFLAGSSKDVSNRPTFIPMVIFKQKVHQWKWIGTCRDKDTDLVPLFEHWLETKDNAASNAQISPVAGLQRTEYIVAPSSMVEKSEYQIQERQRYENPHKPFIYKMHGFNSIVAPVKGVFTKESNLNKAREHSLLVSKRPPYVTILTLVRDAAARLPNGEGTRAEVCLLLKDSQYINPTATDAQIHTVVSGALDRLHYEKDPCVKYDNARKVWIYLHKTRTIEEFEKLHEASAAAARAKKQQNQKQKLLKQQQKAKEAAVGISDSSYSTVSEDAKGPKISLNVLNIGHADPTKAKKSVKPKRPPSANPKKQDKAKAKPQSESVEMTSRDLTNIQPPLPPVMPKIDSFPHLQQVRPVAPQQSNVQDQNLLHNREPSINFPRTSRLNSPYVYVGQPVKENTCYSMDLNQSGGDVPNDSDSSSSGDSETESSEGEEGISPGISASHRQDPRLQYGEQRMPFNNVMSMFQNKSDDRDSTFGGY